MKPSEIFDIMDLAFQATKNGSVFNPLFSGPPGVGKSHIVQAWANSKGLPFIDLRIAYMEAPDLIGFPSIETQDGRQITRHNIPEFLPTSGQGVLLLEEPNRGTTSVMNCLMQLLTDRKIHKYELPEGWVIVGCINPDGGDYDTNAMDPALKNRFVQFNVTYDKESFVSYMKATEFHPDILNFIEAGLWTFSDPEKFSNSSVPGAKYISPRTMEQVNSALQTGDSPLLRTHELSIYEAILGVNVAKDFYNFRHNESPVMMADLLKGKKGALKKLVKFSDPSNYKNGMISLTVRDIVELNTIEDDLLSEVIEVLPVEQGKALIHELEFKRNQSPPGSCPPGTILNRLGARNSKIRELFRSVVNLGKEK